MSFGATFEAGRWQHNFDGFPGLLPTSSLLMSPHVTPELLHLAYRSDLEILIGRWGYQPPPTALPAEYERLTAAALAHGAHRWLQDIRRRTLNDPATTQWLLTDYFPDMARQLGARLRVAYLVSPTLYQHILAEPGFAPAEAYVGRPFALAFFGEEGPAVDWLRRAETGAN